MQAIDSLTKHYKNLGIEQIVVDDWVDDEGNAFVIYYAPFTLGEVARLERFMVKGEAELAVECLIIKALDANRKKLFKQTDRPTLLNYCDQNMISNIVKEIMKKAEGETAEEMGKNLEPTPS